MSRNDYISTNGSLNLDTIFNNIDNNTSGLAEKAKDLKQRGINVETDFGIIGDGVTDNTQALAELETYLRSLNGRQVEVIFPSGVYLYTQSPNWGITNLTLTGIGAVILKCTGSVDKAFNMDASPDEIRRFYDKIKMRNFIIEGNSTILNGFYRRNIVRSHFENIEVREINPTTGKAFHLRFGVSNLHVNLTHSVNSVSTPNMAYEGLFLSNTDVGGDKPTNETFINTRIEGTNGIGIRLYDADLCTFIGGTSEANTIYGIVNSSTTKGNQFIGMALEGNGTADVSEGGENNRYQGCDSLGKILLLDGAIIPQIVGGFHQTIEIQANCKNPIVENLSISHKEIGGSVIHNNNKTAKIANVRNAQDGTMVYGAYMMSAFKTRTSITVGASPFKYTNSSQFPMLLNILGGNVTQLLWGYGGDSTVIGNVATKGVVNGQFMLMPKDDLTVSYTELPTMNYIPR